MAKEDKKVEQVKEVANGVNVPASKADFVQLVKESTQAMGLSSFVRVNLDKHVTDAGLEALSEEYEKQGYEVFSNKKSVVMIKQ